MNVEPASEETQPDLSAKGIWQQWPGESDKSYTAFTQYLQLGSDASMQEVADKTGKKPSSLYNLSSRYEWATRATAHRQHFQAIAHDAMEKATSKSAGLWATRGEVWREQNWESFQKLNFWCHQAVNHALTKPVVEMAPYEVQGLLSLAPKLGHQAAIFGSTPKVERDINSDPAILLMR